MNVVYCVTYDYLEKIKPSIKSLREHNPDVNIYVVTETPFAGIKDVKVVNIRDQKWFMPETCVNYFNIFTYIGLLKVCYPSILDCDKVIHMDADTIVCDSLEDMWNIDLTGKWYAMCNEQYGRYKIFGDKYYNAGVFVLNLEQMRKDNIQDRMVEYLNTVPQPYCEQDAFNKFGIEEDMIVEMPIRFNENGMVGKTANPAIIHYCGYVNWWDDKSIDRAEYLAAYQ